MFIRPRHFDAKIESKTQITPTVLEVILKLKGSESWQYEPGQFVNIEAAPECYRSYSIASTENKQTHVKLYINNAHHGVGSNFFTNSKIGDNIKFIGPSGKFTLRENEGKNVIFIATGNGIAPYFPMINSLLENRDLTIHLIYGARFEREIIREDQLKSFVKLNKNFSYTICLSQEEQLIGHNRKRGRVTEYISNSDFTDKLLTDTQFYLCGNPQMIEDSLTILQNAGVKAGNIYFEKF